jgi:hypothetical protein
LLVVEAAVFSRDRAMNISFAYPPMYADIVKRFAVTATTVFAWGETIYNPGRVEISEDLMAHETVHSGQQAAIGGPKAWWDRYLVEPAFLVSQEAEAYGRQYAVLGGRVKDRNARFRMLRELASHFSGPLYDYAVTFDEAVRLIKLNAASGNNTFVANHTNH